MKSSTHVDITREERTFRNACCGGRKCTHHTRLTWLGVELALADKPGSARPSLPSIDRLSPAASDYVARHKLADLDPDELAVRLDTAYRRFIKRYGPQPLSSRWEAVA